jgi:radical SAM superfamily enzyme YgiQ (UPF0313 family)
VSAKRVTFLELTVFDGVAPLASGYMQAYACKDPELAAQLAFAKISLTATTPYEALLAELDRHPADVYGLSCYVWNTGAMRRVLADLLRTRPGAHFVLGGPQVMNQGARYLSPEHENVLICNGEGERTFANILRATLAPHPDFSTVRGVSFFRDGALITTEAEPRIQDLAEIPSPYLEGLFEKDRYVWTVIETNRGCPFKCNYCYWGAAIGSKVQKYGEDRVAQELTSISESGYLYLFIADANWGMQKRDVELSRHIADCKKKAGMPMIVYFAGAKNSPERVAEITEIFSEAGLVATQSIALQTMSPDTLKKVNRDNVKSSVYLDLQQRLNEKNLSSFIELIWPLPGETIASFQSGLAKLCAAGADSFIIYPLLLMNNVELAALRDEYQLHTVPDPDPNSEAEIVIQTKEVDRDAYHEGIRTMYAVTALYCLRGLWCLGRYLASRDENAYLELVRAFMEFCRERPDHPYTQFCEGTIARFEQHRFETIGKLTHLITHQGREAFDDLLGAFVRSRPFWADEAARFFFEVDLIHRPCVYRNTPILAKAHRFEWLKVKRVLPHGYEVAVPARYLDELSRFIVLPGTRGGASAGFEVNHRRKQLPFMPGKTMTNNYSYCQDMLHKMRSLLPIWSELAGPASLPVASDLF